MEARLALAVEIHGTHRFAGTVTELTESTCRFLVRNTEAPVPGTVLRLLFRTSLGQATLDAEVDKVVGQEAFLVPKSAILHFHERTSPRKVVKNVYARCEVEGMDVTLRVLDIAEGGFRFASVISLPTEISLDYRFIFHEYSFHAVGKVVRQSQEVDGNWSGGVMFDKIERTELPTFRHVLDQAA